eukprot:scaffold21988_cov20-Tisochrysis_lutea.AAC.1
MSSAPHTSKTRLGGARTPAASTFVGPVSLGCWTCTCSASGRSCADVLSSPSSAVFNWLAGYLF